MTAQPLLHTARSMRLSTEPASWAASPEAHAAPHSALNSRMKSSSGTRNLLPDRNGRARELIEDLMIAANGATARFLEGRHSPSIRRVLHAPTRWNRIVALAAQTGGSLPPTPDALALNTFLARRRQVDPEGFADLSRAVVKSLGRGEYVAEPAGQRASGHFSLAVSDYAHSTAPNHGAESRSSRATTSGSALSEPGGRRGRASASPLWLLSPKRCRRDRAPSALPARDTDRPSPRLPPPAAPHPPCSRVAGAAHERIHALTAHRGRD